MRVENSHKQGIRGHPNSYILPTTSTQSTKTSLAMENGQVPRVAQAVNHNGTSRPLSALCKHKSKSFGSNPGQRDLKSGSSVMCARRLWIFFVLGITLFVIGGVVTLLYFNIRELTTTLEYAEVLPTYVPAAAMAVAGCCVFVLFWRRLRLLVIFAIVACVTTALLNTIAVTLTGTHVIRVIQTLSQCRYYSDRRVCYCTSPYIRSNLDLQYSPNAQDFMAYIFEDADNCDSIHSTLLQLVYGLCAGYTAGVCLCVAAAILAAHTLRTENAQQKLKKDVYEEVYTVSGGSSVASDSDNEQTVHQETLSSSVTQRTSTVERKPPNVILRRSHSLVQERETRLEESTDNLLTDTSVESSAASARVKQKKRRHKRAMTLHNLDSKQLMLILSLQMRYLQETENLRDLQKQTQHQDTGRRTPNPGRCRTPNPQTQRAPSAPPCSGQYSAAYRAPNAEAASRVRSPPPYDASVPQLPSGNSLPHRGHEAQVNTPGVTDNMPRYVSLPKLPRRSQTPQATSMNRPTSRTSNPRIPNSNSDPNIIQHLGPDVLSKTDMLVQRQGQQKTPSEQNYRPSRRHHLDNLTVPGRAQMLPSYPTRVKTPDGNYAQISSYHRRQTPSAASTRANSGSQPLPPVRSVSCENTLQRPREGQARETYAQQPSNYAEVTYASQNADGAARRLRDEELYARPIKSAQILVNDAYVDLYPVLENSRSIAQRPLPRTPPPPPPYPDGFPPSTHLMHLNDQLSAARDVHVRSNQSGALDNDVVYGRTSTPQSNSVTPNVFSQAYSLENPQNYLRSAHTSASSGHMTQTGDSSHLHSQTACFPDRLSQPVYDTSGATARQQQQQRELQQHWQQNRGQNAGGASFPSHSFRPIDNSVSGRQSPPVREHVGHQGALVLHNSDEDSDSEFMETVI